MTQFDDDSVMLSELIERVHIVQKIAKASSLGTAISLCAELGSHALDRPLQQELGVDKAQFSRWQNGTEGIIWPKFSRLMDVCGNDSPLLWMAYQRGYDLHSMRKRETETEQENRLLREENAALRRVLRGSAI